ncbi:MAG: lysophospholipase, partial [bacterium]|nr:lysophospholipase [bacterium]
MPSSSNNKSLLMIIVIFIILILCIYLYRIKNNPEFKIVKNSQSNKNTTETQKSIPTPTQTPFIELTIPHLKERKYESKIGELKQVSQYTNYTSYTTYYDSDNLNINALITLPNETTPPGGWPAIVFVHGYIPPTQYKTTEKYVDYVDNLAKNKFVVFKIDLRGHGDSEGEPGGAYYSSDYVIDSLN